MLIDKFILKMDLEAKKMLQKWREDNIRCPEKVRDLWKHCLNSGKHLGDESKQQVRFKFRHYFIKIIVIEK